MNTDRKPLFTDFPKQNAAQWESQILKELKGKSLADVTSIGEDGITINPFYHNDEVATHGKFWKNDAANEWQIVEKITVSDVKQANKKALNALMNGATAIWFTGNITSDTLSSLLNEISIPHIQLWLEPNNNIASLQEGFISYCQEHCPKHQINGGVIDAPLTNIASKGKWSIDKAEALQTIANYNDTITKIDGCQWRNAGCSLVQELAIFLAESNDYLGLQLSNNVDDFADNVIFNTGIGENYFFEIAKIRAARLLWNNLVKGYSDSVISLHIHGENITLNKAIYDQHNNLLRTSTEAMSAILGGCDSLHIAPFDNAYSGNSVLGERMARNIQSILKEESYFDKIADPANGSYYIESLTEEIAQKAWNLFQAIEAGGGYIKAIESNQLQEMAATTFTEKEIAYENGEQIILGVNRYPNAAEEVTAKEIVTNAPIKNGAQFMAIQTTRLAAKQEAERAQKLAH
jgi:methylmalonyl-CoA mutase